MSIFVYFCFVVYEVINALLKFVHKNCHCRRRRGWHIRSTVRETDASGHLPGDRNLERSNKLKARPGVHMNRNEI